jgi:parvulin-like peptidyl-prolyl isomerase
MRRLFGVLVLSVLIFTACGKKEKFVTLKPDQPAYALGKALSPILSVLDPDSNKVLVTTKYFDITAGEVLFKLQANFGKRTEGLKNMPMQQLQNVIGQSATQFAEERLILKASKKAKIKSTSAEIDSFLNLQYQKAGGEEKLKSGLEENQIQFDYFMESIGKNLTIEKYLDHIIKERSEITEERIQKAYQEFLKDTLVNVQHVLLLTNNKSDAEKKAVRNKMAKILSRARSGESFDALAKEFSEDPGSKDKGGLYENVNRGQMVKPFEDACFSVPVGKISDIVETSYGYHILKIISRKPGGKPLEEMRDELVKKLQGSGSRSIMNEFFKEIREEAEVKLVGF